MEDVRCAHRDRRGRCSKKAISALRGEAYCKAHLLALAEALEAERRRLEDDFRVAQLARFDEILALREQGMTLAEIGARFGLTRERVRQILVERVGSSISAPARRRRRSNYLQNREARISKLADEIKERGLDGRSGAEALSVLAPEERLGGSLYKDVLDALTLLGRTPLDSRIRRAERLSGYGFTDEGLYECLRTAASAYPGKELTCGRYERVAVENNFPTYQTMMMRFETWYEACRRAGIETPTWRAHRIDYISPERCWQDVLACVRTLGDWAPTLQAYDAWQRSENAGVPRGAARRACPAVVRRRVGTWAVVLRRLRAEQEKRTRGRGGREL